MNPTIVTCPSCGANLSGNIDKGMIRCEYCQNTIQINNIAAMLFGNQYKTIDIKEYLDSAEDEIKNKCFDIAANYYREILRYFPANFEAQWGLFRCEFLDIENQLTSQDLSGGDEMLNWNLENLFREYRESIPFLEKKDKQELRNRFIEGLIRLSLDYSYTDFLFSVFEKTGANDKRLLNKIVDINSSDLSNDEAEWIGVNLEKKNDNKEKALMLLRDLR